MHLSTHYYVICLGARKSALFEAFRDTLIDIHNHGFPLQASAAATGRPESPDGDDRLRESLRAVDERFHHCYKEEPLMVVVTGETKLRAAFASMTAHKEAIAGQVDGDYSATSTRDLGKIVWPVVKEAISGVRERALRELEAAAEEQTVCGLEAIGRRVDGAAGATLLVEEDYHVRGSISEADGSAAISLSVDVRDEIDDVVDMLAEKVLRTGGRVVFMPGGALSAAGRIVFIFREAAGAQ